MKIHWNGFLKTAVDEYPKEACAFLFSDKPYDPKEEWHVFQIRNASPDPLDRWEPDKKDMEKVKTKAMKMGLTKIGNIHTHPCPDARRVDEFFLPSETDLKFARKFNDIIRGIIVVNKKAIYGASFHDKFGKRIPIMVVEEDV